MDCKSFRVTAHASDFDIDDLAAAKVECCFCLPLTDNTFVEAQGGSQVFLQGRMLNQVVVVEGLFDHQEIEVIKFRQVIRVGERVSGISVNRKQNTGEETPHFGDDVDVPTGFDLQLDPLITEAQIAFDAFQQLR